MGHFSGVLKRPSVSRQYLSQDRNSILGGGVFRLYCKRARPLSSERHPEQPALHDLRGNRHVKIGGRSFAEIKT